MTSQLIIADIVERKRNISEVWFKKSLALPKKIHFFSRVHENEQQLFIIMKNIDKSVVTFKDLLQICRGRRGSHLAILHSPSAL